MRMNYKSILGELKKACSGVSTTIYTSSRPAATDGIKDFVVCSIPITIRDRGAYGETACRFTLYAKDLNGVENYTRLAEMQEKLYSNLPINNTACAIWEPVVIPGGSDGSGFHFLHIQANLIIY